MTIRSGQLQAVTSTGENNTCKNTCNDANSMYVRLFNFCWFILLCATYCVLSRGIGHWMHNTVFCSKYTRSKLVHKEILRRVSKTKLIICCDPLETMSSISKKIGVKKTRISLRTFFFSQYIFCAIFLVKKINFFASVVFRIFWNFFAWQAQNTWNWNNFRNQKGSDYKCFEWFYTVALFEHFYQCVHFVNIFSNWTRFLWQIKLLKLHIEKKN